jgi:hypothetical protein
MNDDRKRASNLTTFCMGCWTVYYGKTPQEAADKAKACSERHEREGKG